MIFFPDLPCCCSVSWCWSRCCLLGLWISLRLWRIWICCSCAFWIQHWSWPNHPRSRPCDPGSCPLLWSWLWWLPLWQVKSEVISSWLLILFICLDLLHIPYWHKMFSACREVLGLAMCRNKDIYTFICFNLRLLSYIHHHIFTFSLMLHKEDIS